LNSKAQTSIEIFLVVATILALLLLVSVISMQRNISIQARDELNRNAQICGVLSQHISTFQLNQGYSETIFEPEGDIHLEKNNIVVGGTSCYFSNRTQFQTAQSTFTSDLDAGGFDLEQGKRYAVKKTNGEVTFCEIKETPDPWC